MDELFGDGAKDDIDLDLQAILGPSIDGAWQPEETGGEADSEEEKMETAEREDEVNAYWTKFYNPLQILVL